MSPRCVSRAWSPLRSFRMARPTRWGSCASIPPMPTVDELNSAEYAALGEFTHDTLIDFVVEYFFRRTSWLTWLHHALSLLTLIAIIAVAIAQGRGVLRCLADFALALAALFLFLLPL